MPHAVFALARDRAHAESIVARLRESGFSNRDISLVLPESSEVHALAFEKQTKLPEGALAGSAAGGMLGGVLGWLAGAGALAIPGIGPLLGAGPLLAALSGITAGGTLGGATGIWIGSGIPEYEAKLYEGEVSGGRVLLSVHARGSEESSRIHSILELEGAEKISSGEEKRVE